MRVISLKFVLFLTAVALTAVLLTAVLLPANEAYARPGRQSDVAMWQEPLNLSQAGGAAQPRFVVDAAGTGHLLWRDEFQGFRYSRHDNLTLAGMNDWSVPATSELPFSTRRFFPDLSATAATPHFNPYLLADGAGRVHAFWIDNEGRLFHSSVAEASFLEFSAWSSRQQLADAARVMAVVLGADGRMHLAYVQTAATSGAAAGIYYRGREGDTWSPAILLYESAYLRGIPAETAHIQIAAARQEPNDYIYVAWDNPSRERLFIARSLDNGLNWEAPQPVDSRRPEDGAQAAGPARLMIYAEAANVLLTWQAGHGDRTCEQYYRWSNDGGAAWSGDQSMSDWLDGCPETLQLLAGGPGVGLLLARQETQGSLLLAWDGMRWSERQPQPALDNFVDPVTFRPVEFGCYQAVVNGQGALFVAGCDQGRSQDIWLTARPLGDMAAWFAPPPAAPVWRPSVSVAEADGMLAGLTLVGDGDGRFHALWVGEGATAVAYARAEGGQWSRPSPVLHSPEAAVVGQPAAVVVDARLLAAWHDESGGLFFSWANAARATAASEWTEPRLLPAHRPLISGVDMAVDRGHTIYVVYTIPLNEERGVYLTRSEDDGQSWSAALNLFDGVAAGWVAVGAPRLAVASDGRLHASWTGQNLAGQAQGLYYASSTDGGATWSAHTAAAGGAVAWQHIVAVGDQVVHQLWAGQGNTNVTGAAQPALWHRVSNDSGQSWSRPARVAGLGDNPLGPVGAALDAAGRLQVVQIAPAGAADGPALLQLHQWTWEEERWQAAPPFDLGHGLAGDFALPAAAAASGEQLGFAYLLPAVANGAPLFSFSDRQLAPPAVAPTPLPTLTPTQTPIPLPSATRQPEPTPTAVFPIDAQAAPRFNLPLPDARFAAPIMGVIPAAFLIIIALFIGMYTMRRK